MKKLALAAICLAVKYEKGICVAVAVTQLAVFLVLPQYRISIVRWVTIAALAQLFIAVATLPLVKRFTRRHPHLRELNMKIGHRPELWSEQPKLERRFLYATGIFSVFGFAFGGVLVATAAIIFAAKLSLLRF